MTQETYSLLSLSEDLDEDRNLHTKYAPFENLLSVTHLITQLLTNQAPASSVPYAIQGGFSMQLRGGRRSTRDVDLLTTIKMKGVWEAITGEPRIVIPDTRLIEGVLKVFVKTGASWDACGEEHKIEVDIKQAGFRGSPRTLKDHADKVGPFDLFGSAVRFYVLNVAYMMKTKVDCCLSREEPRDFEDVKFMIRSYAEQVRAAIEAGIVNAEDLAEVLEHEKLGDEEIRKDLASAAGV